MISCQSNKQQLNLIPRLPNAYYGSGAFDHLTAVTGVGSSPLVKTKSARGCLRCFFSGFSRFRPTY